MKENERNPNNKNKITEFSFRFKCLNSGKKEKTISENLDISREIRNKIMTSGI